MIYKYSDYIKETVYLFKTMFDSYGFIVNINNGNFIVGIDGNKYNIHIELYGLPKEKQFILREPSEISIMNNNKDIFELIINDIIYILNKNKLKYKFTLIEIDKELSSTTYHAIIESNKETSILDLERIVTTTKITNPKVKDTGNFDKMIYQTTK